MTKKIQPRLQSTLSTMPFGTPEHIIASVQDKISNGIEQELPIEAISLNPLNKWRNYDAPEVLALGESIKSYMQIHAIGVISANLYREYFPDLANEIDPVKTPWVACWGNRRLAAMRKVGLPAIRVTKLDNKSKTELLELVTLENEHREQTPPTQQALDFKMLMGIHGSQQAVAERLRLAQPVISRHLRLLKLIPELQTVVDQKRITLTEAQKYARLSVEDQLKAWKKLAARLESEEENYTSSIIAGQSVEVPKKVRYRNIRVGEPQQMVEQLRKHMTPEQITALVTLLLSSSTP